jgi:hypothetical protein
LSQDQQQPRKKVSVGEALESMRGKAAPAAPAKTSIVGLGASYWLESLLEGASRRQADLYESIRDNPSAQAQMQRRDLRVVGDLQIPSAAMEEVRQPKPPPEPRRAKGLRERFGSIGSLYLDSNRLEVIATDAPVQQVYTEPGEAAVRSVASRFSQVSSLDLASFYAVEEVGTRPHVESQPSTPGTVSLSRFNGITTVDLQGGLELLEVRQQPVADDLPKRRLRTNPNIRKMFQQNDELEAS